MSQQVQETKPWVLISAYRDNTTPNDLQRISPQIQSLIDEWQSTGKIMWSGAFNDNKTGMAIFEGTEHDAKEFYQKYDHICSGILEYSMQQWMQCRFSRSCQTIHDWNLFIVFVFEK